MRRANVANGWSIAAGVLLHLLLVAGPVALLAGIPALLRLTSLALFLISGAWVALEAGAVSTTSLPTSTNSRDCLARTLAAINSLFVLAVFWVSLLTAGAHSPLLPATGSMLMIVGVVLRRTAIGQLGRQFRTEIVAGQGQFLVTNGIYAQLRHPSETGLLFICGGASLVTASWPALVVTLLLLLPFGLWRLRLEERQLSDAFGSQYARYRRRVGGLVPKLLTAG